MKAFLPVVSVWVAAAVFAFAEEREDGVSSSGKIAWHVVETRDGNGAEVFISEGDQGESAAQKLCDVVSVASTRVFVAPDDSRIIVENGSASLGVSLTVFQRENGMIYSAKPASDPAAAALTHAAGGDPEKVGELGKSSAKLIAWSKDSDSVLISMSWEGGKSGVSGFMAIYSFGTGKIGFDLAKFHSAPQPAR